MKHLPIGKLTENIKDGKKTYKLNLFNGAVIETFDNIPDALEVIAYHGEEIIVKHGLISEICVLVKHHDKRKHYILMDLNWVDGGKLAEVKVYEETVYEYISSHSAFKRLYRRRRFINERKFDFNDIVRSSVNWSPWFTRIFSSLLGLLLIFGASCLVSFFDFVNVAGESSLNHVQDIAFKLGTWFSVSATFVLPILYTLSFHINKKMLKENDFEYGRLNWRKWYVYRMNMLKLCFLIYGVTLYFDITTVVDLWDVDSSKAKLVKFNMLILSCLLGLSIISVSYVIFWLGSIKLIWNLHVYLTKDERLFFWRWYWKRTEQMLVKIDYNFFFLDPEETAATAKLEIEETTQIIQRMTKSEISDYVKKSKHAHKHGVSEYVRILNEKTANILKDNQ